jgi:hypothetical protein
MPSVLALAQEFAVAAPDLKHFGHATGLLSTEALMREMRTDKGVYVLLKIQTQAEQYVLLGEAIPSTACMVPKFRMRSHLGTQWKETERGFFQDVFVTGERFSRKTGKV